MTVGHHIRDDPTERRRPAILDAVHHLFPNYCEHSRVPVSVDAGTGGWTTVRVSVWTGSGKHNGMAVWRGTGTGGHCLPSDTDVDVSAWIAVAHSGEHVVSVDFR